MATKGGNLKHREDGRSQGLEKPRWAAATGSHPAVGSAGCVQILLKWRRGIILEIFLLDEYPLSTYNVSNQGNQEASGIEITKVAKSLPSKN